VSSDKFGNGRQSLWRDGDSNYDGLLDMLDAAAFASTGLFDAGLYNVAPTVAVAPVPEPSTFAGGVAAATLACMWAFRCRRRLPFEGAPLV